MIVTYLGSKSVMYAHGYDFTDGPVDVPETDDRSIGKFLGNRYFHCDHIDNYVAPKFYVHEIQNIRLPNDDLGNPRFKRIRGSAKGRGFATEESAEKWVEMNGRLNETHYIIKSKEGIADVKKKAKPAEKVSKEISIGVFKVQQDGKPYSRPEKVFTGPDEGELKVQAAEWMSLKEINPDERLIMVK